MDSADGDNNSLRAFSERDHPHCLVIRHEKDDEGATSHAVTCGGNTALRDEGAGSELVGFVKDLLDKFLRVTIRGSGAHLFFSSSMRAAASVEMVLGLFEACAGVGKRRRAGSGPRTAMLWSFRIVTHDPRSPNLLLRRRIIL